MNRDAPSSIRLAISREDYPKALKLWNAYVGELWDALQHRALTGADIGEMRELFDWGIVVLRGARAHLQAQINKVHGAAAYLPSSATSPATSGFIRTSL
jgi:hypothetical protein